VLLDESVQVCEPIPDNVPRQLEILRPASFMAKTDQVVRGYAEKLSGGFGIDAALVL
jgi:hypothetical protein